MSRGSPSLNKQYICKEKSKEIVFFRNKSSYLNKGGSPKRVLKSLLLAFESRLLGESDILSSKCTEGGGEGAAIPDLL